MSLLDTPTLIASAVLLGLAVAYALIFGRFAIGLRRVLAQATPTLPEHPPFVSILIPARDEEDAIAECITSVLANDYPADCFEVLVIDDGSTDDTVGVIRRIQARLRARQPVPAGTDDDHPNEALRLVQVPPGADGGIQQALAQGIAQARGEIILRTDADCRVGPAWIRTMAAAFRDGVGFVSGPVLYEARPGVYQHVVALEFLGHVAVGAGAIGAGQPVLCNGANSAFRRRAYDEVGGFDGLDHLAAGDDDVLMQRIAYQTPWDVRFCQHPTAAVHTPPPPGYPALFAQRRRWASKAGRYEEPALVRTNVAIFLHYVSLLIGLALLPLWPALGPAMLGAFTIKTAADAAVLVPAARHYGTARRLWVLIPAQPFQVAHTVITVLAGALGGFTWKQRSAR